MKSHNMANVEKQHKLFSDALDGIINQLVDGESNRKKRTQLKKLQESIVKRRKKGKSVASDRWKKSIAAIMTKNKIAEAMKTKLDSTEPDPSSSHMKNEESLRKLPAQFMPFLEDVKMLVDGIGNLQQDRDKYMRNISRLSQEKDSVENQLKLLREDLSSKDEKLKVCF